MNAILRRGLAWLFWSVGLVLVARGMVVTEESLWAIAALVLGGTACGIVGLILALRVNTAVGWAFLALQASCGLVALGVGNGNEIFMAIAVILLIFPTGRIPSQRWRWAWWVIGLNGVLVVFADYFEILPDLFELFLVFVGSLLAVMVASVWRLTRDYRRSTGVVRQQLKWFVWILLLGGGILALSLIPVPYLDDAHELAGVVLFVGAPIAVLMALTRYRLYEIDRIISRTVSYTIVVGILAGAIAAMATAVSTQFDSPLVVAATTLGVAAAFNPLRKRVQVSVDRRFNRSKYDHERVVERFTITLRQGFDVEGLVDGWLSVVDETMQPRQIGVWTRVS